jgi:quinol monooxygenase YgiN
MTSTLGVSGTEALTKKESQNMYGLISKLRAVPGKRDDLASILVAGTTEMPGCFSYIVAADQDALWVTEVWESPQSHSASLALPAVQQAIAQGKPLIAGFGERFETLPIGGVGIDDK